METTVFVFWLYELGARHLTIIEGRGGGHLPIKITCRAGHFTNFFKCLGFAWGGGVLVAGIDSHISWNNNTLSDNSKTPFIKHQNSLLSSNAIVFTGPA